MRLIGESWLKVISHNCSSDYTRICIFCQCVLQDQTQRVHSTETHDSAGFLGLDALLDTQYVALDLGLGWEA